MGLFDTVKLKANALAADAERAGKVTAAQAHTVVLQNDIRKAERELGHSAFSLIESGAIAHPDLEAASARLRDARQALADKETEIEALRGRMPETRRHGARARRPMTHPCRPGRRRDGDAGADGRGRRSPRSRPGRRKRGEEAGAQEGRSHEARRCEEAGAAKPAKTPAPRRSRRRAGDDRRPKTTERASAANVTTRSLVARPGRLVA